MTSAIHCAALEQRQESHLQSLGYAVCRAMNEHDQLTSRIDDRTNLNFKGIGLEMSCALRGIVSVINLPSLSGIAQARTNSSGRIEEEDKQVRLGTNPILLRLGRRHQVIGNQWIAFIVVHNYFPIQHVTVLG